MTPIAIPFKVAKTIRIQCHIFSLESILLTSSNCNVRVLNLKTDKDHQLKFVYIVVIFIMKVNDQKLNKISINVDASCNSFSWQITCIVADVISNNA